MSRIERKIKHKSGALITPESVTFLYAHDDATRKGYRYVDLMIGSFCGDDIFAYIGINDLHEDCGYEPISKKKHADWIARLETNRVKAHKLKLDPRFYSDVPSLTVTGSVYDQRSGKYFFRQLIPVN